MILWTCWETKKSSECQTDVFCHMVKSENLVIERPLILQIRENTNSTLNRHIAYGVVSYNSVDILEPSHNCATELQLICFQIIWYSFFLIGMAYNFHKYDTTRVDSRGVPYDYDSIMHYSSTAFANRAGVRTIVGKNGRTNLGQRYGLSKKDIQQANLLYGCGTRPPVTAVPPKPPTPPPPGK